MLKSSLFLKINYKIWILQAISCVVYLLLIESWSSTTGHFTLQNWCLGIAFRVFSLICCCIWNALCYVVLAGGCSLYIVFLCIWLHTSFLSKETRIKFCCCCLLSLHASMCVCLICFKILHEGASLNTVPWLMLCFTKMCKLQSVLSFWTPQCSLHLYFGGWKLVISSSSIIRTMVWAYLVCLLSYNYTILVMVLTSEAFVVKELNCSIAKVQLHSVLLFDLVH